MRTLVYERHADHILLSGTVIPGRARALIRALGHTTAERGYLELLLAKED
jgi:hypothetical protein